MCTFACTALWGWEVATGGVGLGESTGVLAGRRGLDEDIGSGASTCCAS